MFQRVENSPNRIRPAGPSAGFYVSLVLAILLIISGLWVLWQTNQASTSEQVTVSRFVTPEPEEALAPDFTLQTIGGDTVKLSDYRGQVVLLNTWATWCPPCRAEMPDLEDYYREHQADGFVVLAVNSQESPATVTAFLGDYEFTFPVLLDPDGTVMSSYNVYGLPTSFFIDRDGMVSGVWSGQLSPGRLEELVDPLL
jgi:cytochrome c biogenesis protein CcmG/thiol:disulfide interchange protein DsbE